MNTELYLAISPILVVALGGVLLMLAEAFSHRREESDVRSSGPSSEIALGTAITLFTGAIFAGAVWFVGPEHLPGARALAPWIIVDRFGLFFAFVTCLGGGLASLLAGGYLPEHRLDRGEFYPLLTFSTIGCMILAQAGDFLSLFIGLETMSLGVYALTGFRRASPRSTEAAVKYFLLGSFAAALLLYGGALLYGATGHTDFAGLGAGISALPKAGGERVALVLVGSVLVLAGLVFKVSAVPFHAWTPDAYEGAPTPATTFMAVAVKSAAFATLLRVLLGVFKDPGLSSWAAGWPPVIAALAVLTMTVANLVAGRQESVKRMLAYSSIAHAGYVLVGVVAIGAGHADDAQGSVLFYLLAYTVSTVGAFGALILCGSRGLEVVSYEDLSGLGKRHPAIALTFTLFLLSLAGIPPTAGFFGKLYIVRGAIGAGLYPLAIVMLLNSVLGAYYYLRVLVFMYMREPAPGAAVAKPMRSGQVTFALVVAATLVVVMGVWPTTPLDVAVHAALGR
jgi:NADH-quinone oxidoreductase subunit N